MACIESRIQVRTHCCSEKQEFGYPWLSRNIPNTPTEAEPSFRRINLPPAKLEILFPTYL